MEAHSRRELQIPTSCVQRPQKYIDEFNLRKLIEFEVETLEVEVVERDLVIEQHHQRADYWEKEYCEAAVNP